MLYMPTEAAKPKRLQGCFVSDPELERLVFFWGGQKVEELTQIKIEPISSVVTGGREPPKDPLLEQARKLADGHDQVSTSFLQRKLQIGYPRAARLKELLDEESGRGTDNLSMEADEDSDENGPDENHGSQRL